MLPVPNIFLSILLIISLYSCQKDPGQRDLILIPDEFVLDLSQKITSEGPTPSFYFTTLDRVDCKTKDLVTYYSQVGKKILIYLDRIQLEEECEGVERFLSKEIYSYIPFGTFDVEIKVRNIIENSGTLKINAQSFTLEMKTSYGFREGKSLIRRIPPNHIWGNIHCKSGCPNGIESIFKTYMEGYVQDSDVLEMGEYGLFSVTSDYVTFRNYSRNIENKQFIFKMVLEKSEIKNRLNEFKVLYPDISLTVMSSTGPLF